MSRNYCGERLRKNYILDCLTRRVKSLLRDEYDVDDLMWKYWHDDPLCFFACRFANDYNKQNKQLYPKLQDRVAAYLRGIPDLGLPFADYQFLELKAEWGFKTPDSKWTNQFFDMMARVLIKLCHEKGYVLNVLW